MPRALITGVTGQDGQYLAEFLHEKEYEVFGLVHGQNNIRADRLQEQLPFVTVVEGDLSDLSSLIAALELSQPDEVYNLAGISFVPLSYKQPELTVNVNALGVLRLLEAIRIVGPRNPAIRFYQASSSEMFGSVNESPQNERTPFRPNNPYASSKVLAYNLTRNYRDAYGMFASSGILYNHESPRRSIEFVTRKISSAVARIKLGLQTTLAIGDLEARRDWGYAGDYVRAMWLMLQQGDPRDYVVATGATHSVRDLLDVAFQAVQIEQWEPYVTVDPRFVRPPDVTQLVGDPTEARRDLSWAPEVDFVQLIEMMVQHDLVLEEEKLQHARR